MGRLLDHIFTPLHKKTARDYIGRMTDHKVECMGVAKQYDRDYWDGDRRYGYGGYRYDGRWKAVAETLIREYRLPPNARILDVGCGKAYLLHELKQLLPDAEIHGFDSSAYALEHAKPEIRDSLFQHRAQDPYPFEDKHFNLVMSLTTLHNLKLPELKSALGEIERVGKQGFILVESFRNDQEQFNLQCWALTCAAFFTPEEWVWLFGEFGYTGDYEFIFFE